MSNRSDNFNRADTTNNINGPSDAGSSWSQLSGTWGISSNQAYKSSTGSQEICVLEANAAVVTLQVTLSFLTGGATDLGAVVRVSDNSNYILAVYNHATSTVAFYTNIAGSFTQLNSASPVAYAQGDVMVVDADAGDNLTMKKNGATVLTATSSFNNTATKHGLRMNGDPAASIGWDDFSITDNTVVAASAILMGQALL